MPLLPGKKSIGKNIKTEMEHGKPKKQALAIALNVSRKKPKKMAKGGAVESAAEESRPMPSDVYADSKNVAQADHKKSLTQSNWTDRPDIAQSQRGPKNPQRIKHPKMAGSGVFQVKLRDQEDDFMETADVNNGPQRQPPEMYNEVDADKKGPDVPALHMKRMANGGEVDEDAPNEISYEDRPDKGYGKIIFKANGGEIENSEMQPESEAEEEHHDSIAAAVMAKRRKAMQGADSDSDIEQMLAEGGAVGPGSDVADIEHENNVEHPNYYYDRNEDFALKENYDEDMIGLHQPKDSNEHGDDIDSDDLDMVDQIRRKMKDKQMFAQGGEVKGKKGEWHPYGNPNADGSKTRGANTYGKGGHKARHKIEAAFKSIEEKYKNSPHEIDAAKRAFISTNRQLFKAAKK